MRIVSLGLALVFICGCAVMAEVLEIPFGVPPSPDGAMGIDEWGDATTIDYRANDDTILVRIHLLHDGESLYLSFESVENPDEELIVPEILVDPDNAKSESWAEDDWWFHISAQDCDAQGEYDDYQRCSKLRPNWIARPNFLSGSGSRALPEIEVRIPISMISLSPNERFGFALRFLIWPSDLVVGWPLGSLIDQPATWGEARLLQPGE